MRVFSNEPCIVPIFDKVEKKTRNNIWFSIKKTCKNLGKKTYIWNLGGFKGKKIASYGIFNISIHIKFYMEMQARQMKHTLTFYVIMSQYWWTSLGFNSNFKLLCKIWCAQSLWATLNNQVMLRLLCHPTTLIIARFYVLWCF